MQIRPLVHKIRGQVSKRIQQPPLGGGLRVKSLQSLARPSQEGAGIPSASTSCRTPWPLLCPWPHQATVAPSCLLISLPQGSTTSLPGPLRHATFSSLHFPLILPSLLSQRGQKSQPWGCLLYTSDAADDYLEV